MSLSLRECAFCHNMTAPFSIRSAIRAIWDEKKGASSVRETSLSTCNICPVMMLICCVNIGSHSARVLGFGEWLRVGWVMCGVTVTTRGVPTDCEIIVTNLSMGLWEIWLDIFSTGSVFKYVNLYILFLNPGSQGLENDINYRKCQFYFNASQVVCPFLFIWYFRLLTFTVNTDNMYTIHVFGN